MVHVFLADGFEETEAIAPIDILRRAELEVATVAINAKNKIVTSSHNIKILCDISETEWDDVTTDMIVLPGGLAGVENLLKSDTVKKAVNHCAKNGKKIGAICAAPMILGTLELCSSVKMTCYPGFEKHLAGYIPTEDSVITDKNITTAKGAGVSLEFGLELVRVLKGEAAADEIKRKMQFNQ